MVSLFLNVSFNTNSFLDICFQLFSTYIICSVEFRANWLDRRENFMSRKNIMKIFHESSHAFRIAAEKRQRKYKQADKLVSLQFNGLTRFVASAVRQYKIQNIYYTTPHGVDCQCCLWMEKIWKLNSSEDSSNAPAYHFVVCVRNT